MAKTIVVYHSGYGHTQRVAQFVAQGANAQVIAIDADGNITRSTAPSTVNRSVSIIALSAKADPVSRWHHVQ